MQRSEHLTVSDGEVHAPKALESCFCFDSATRIARFDFEGIETVNEEQQHFLLDLFERPDVVGLLL
jgi:hypothetical protein